MANSIAPFGIQDLRRRDGGSPTMGMETFLIGSSDPTAIYSGDPVQTLTGQTMQSGGFGSYVTQASSGIAQAYRGVFRGCKYYNTAAQRTIWSAWWPGNGAAGVSSQGDATAYVEIDDQLMFIGQGTSASIIGSSQIGLNIGVTATASQGNQTTGQSVVALATSGIATSSSLPFRIIDFYSNYAPPGGFVNGTDNTTVGQIIVVGANNWDTRNTTGI